MIFVEIKKVYPQAENKIGKSNMVDEDIDVLQESNVCYTRVIDRESSSFLKALKIVKGLGETIINKRIYAYNKGRIEYGSIFMG